MQVTYFNVYRGNCRFSSLEVCQFINVSYLVNYSSLSFFPPNFEVYLEGTEKEVRVEV